MKSTRLVTGTAILASMLGFGAGAAQADVRFFFTSSADPAGLTDPSLAFKDTGGNGTDGSDYALNEERPKVGVPRIDPAREFLYLWVGFEDEPQNRKILGIHLAIDAINRERSRGIYLGNDDNGYEEGPLRWGYESQTRENPMFLTALAEPGIRNRSADRWLYYGGDDRVALLGAFQYYNRGGEIRLGLGRLGVHYADRHPAPKVRFGKNDEQFDGESQPEGTPIRWSTDADARLTDVPEPSVPLLLIVTGALVFRRR